MTGHAWVRSSTTLVAWPVAPGARGSPVVRGLPSIDGDDDGVGELVLLVSSAFILSVPLGASRDSASFYRRGRLLRKWFLPEERGCEISQSIAPH